MLAKSSTAATQKPDHTKHCGTKRQMQLQLQLQQTFTWTHAYPPCLQGLDFNSLPAVLANNTLLEHLDLSGNQVMGGVLPEEYTFWTNLTVFR